jgi:hypothetical protein
MAIIERNVSAYNDGIMLLMRLASSLMRPYFIWKHEYHLRIALDADVDHELDASIEDGTLFHRRCRDFAEQLGKLSSSSLESKENSPQ